MTWANARDKERRECNKAPNDSGIAIKQLTQNRDVQLQQQGRNSSDNHPTMHITIINKVQKHIRQ